MKKYYIGICCSLLPFLSLAQQPAQYTDKDYARSPVWISMLNDTTANYFEVEKAYNIYFQHHELPGDEDDVIGDHEAREKIPSKRKQKKIQADDRMRMNVKRYQVWHMRMQPYVQPDGRILYPSERLQIWREQQNNK